MEGQQQFTAPTKVCPHCGAQAQTTEDRCPNCGKRYRQRRRGGTFVKVMLGVIVGGLVLIVGCVALIGSAVDDVEEEQQAQGITLSEFRSVKQGTSQEDVEAQLGEPESSQEFEQQIPELQDQPARSSCIYYPEKGKPLFEGRSFQLCFDEGKLTSKNSY